MEPFSAPLTLSQISSIEQEVLGTGRDYNKIRALTKALQAQKNLREELLSILCKIFCQLTLEGCFQYNTKLSTHTKTVVSWLRARYNEFVAVLHSCFESSKVEEAQLALDLAFQLCRAQSELSSEIAHSTIPTDGLLQDLFLSLFERSENSVFKYFISNYLKKFCDVCCYCLQSASMIVGKEASEKRTHSLNRLISIVLLLSRGFEPASEWETAAYFVNNAKPNYRQLFRTDLSSMWRIILHADLTKPQRYRILESFQSIVVPNLSKAETALDFLSDCCSQGGSEALLALSALKALIQESGMDYPQLYVRVYHILDSDMMHRKYRSHALRLLEALLSSTHLPAAMIASFTKRLARLCLYSPPASIVAIVPFVYNMIQTHRVCSLMLHRIYKDDQYRSETELMFSDPFDADERDPVTTGAIESSLWELDTLSAHWHPNVAFISKILAEQFLRQSYNLEHFLDHSYNSLVLAEANKRVIKVPSVEHNIPQPLFPSTELSTSSTLGGAIAWTFGERIDHESLSREEG